jgi:hypothetical protein
MEAGKVGGTPSPCFCKDVKRKGLGNGGLLKM